MHSFDHVTFDFDGVIADTESIFAAFDCVLLNEVLEKAGRPSSLTTTEVRALAGNNDVSKLNIVAKNYKFDPTPYKNDFINSRTQKRNTLFHDHPVTLGKNIREFIELLNGRCALATNKTTAKLHPDLEAMELQGLFEIIITCTPPLKKKPAPDLLLEAAKKLNTSPETGAYIGDNPIDMIAAKAANMLPIGFVIEGVDKQSTHAQDLKTAGAQIIIDDFMTLTPYLTKP